MIWRSDRVCVSYKQKHSILSVDTGATKDIPAGDDTGKDAVVVPLPDGCILLSGFERVGVVIDWNCSPAGNTLVWSHPPLAAVAAGAYLASIIGERDVEVHAIGRREKAIVQRLAFPSPCVSLGYTGERIFVACSMPASVHALELLPPSRQVEELLATGRVDEALNLARQKTFPSGAVERAAARLLSMGRLPLP